MIASLIALGAVALVVLIPLSSEYRTLRREGLGRLASSGALLALLPALGLAFIVAAPLQAHPLFQWATIVVVALFSYSLLVARLVGRDA